MALQFRIDHSVMAHTGFADRYREAYQNPATLGVREAEIVTDDIGDRNSDGYNEGEGCHVVRGGRTVEVRAGAYDRSATMIKFVLPGCVGIPDVMIDGRIACPSSYELSWVDRETLVLYWRDMIRAGRRAVVTLK